MKSIISRLLERAKQPLRNFRNTVKRVPYYGRGRFCNVCGKSSSRFLPLEGGRKDAKCVHCGSLERHRFSWLYITRKTLLGDGTPKKMLHVAPELCLESKFKKRFGDNYLTADLYDPRAMVKMDITNIEYPDQSFDIIYCSHVLEHVQDDKRAIREFYRILKRNGWAILNVPIIGDKTFEDPLIVDPSERLKIFFHEDHVRNYGRDYVNRLRDEGFRVKVIDVNDFVQKEEAIQMGLTEDGSNHSDQIFYCTK